MVTVRRQLLYAVRHRNITAKKLVRHFYSEHGKGYLFIIFEKMSRKKFQKNFQIFFVENILKKKNLVPKQLKIPSRQMLS